VRAGNEVGGDKDHGRRELVPNSREICAWQRAGVDVGPLVTVLYYEHMRTVLNEFDRDVSARKCSSSREGSAKRGAKWGQLCMRK
jgi:hypothetical protein